MEQKLGRQTATAAALIMTAAAYFLRRMQLQQGGSLFSWIAVGALAVFALYAGFLTPKKDRGALEEKSVLLLIGTFLAALGMLGGAFSMVTALRARMDLLLGAGGVVTAICFMVVAMDRWTGREVSPVLHMIPALYYAVLLIWDFRDWSRDPMILDYCFDLLALIGLMCATYHYGGFSFDRGQRRMTVFFSLCGLFFGAAAMADGDLGEISMTAGGMLWILCNLWPLLRRSRPEAKEP